MAALSLRVPWRFLYKRGTFADTRGKGGRNNEKGRKRAGELGGQGPETAGGPLRAYGGAKTVNGGLLGSEYMMKS
jgi:hypothetical protein